MAAPLLSIIIPTYNRSAMLRQTLDSILAQTVPLDSTEVIVSDDCSTDDTRQVLNEYRDRMPSMRVFHQEKNLRHAANWEFLQGEARGEFIFILCDDDAIAPDFVESYLGQFEDDPTLDMVLGDIQLRDPVFGPLAPLALDETPEGPVDGPTRCLAQLRSHHMVMSTVYRRSTLMKAGGWDGRVGSHLDCNAYCRASLQSRNTFRIARPMLYFRITPLSWSRKISQEHQAQVAQWYRRKLDFLMADAQKFAPQILPELSRMYATHARIVLAHFELELAHRRLDGPLARKAIRGLLGQFPGSRFDPMAIKVLLISYLGTGWLSALRRVLGKRDPYQAKLELFSRFTSD
jgi:glycosyltransferase involved in cell wall biosynthesis